MQQQQIWLITGISSGLGKALSTAALAAGHYVIGTFRNRADAEAYTVHCAGRGEGLVLELGHAEHIYKEVPDAIRRVGRIDVLVNNAGVGFAGAIEEASSAEARAVMDINFFGALEVTRAVLPFMRAQRSGRILQISSHGGFKAFAGFGIYNASKFALEGMSEALAQEVAPLGIRVTIVEPGPFRTGFAGSRFQMAQNTLADYDATAGNFRTRIKSVDGKQEGDPEKAAAAILDIAQQEQPPLRLPLGAIALVSLTSKIASVQQDLDSCRQVAASAIY